LNYNLEGKIFASVSNTENGEVNEDTLFYYHQEGNTVWAEYEGGAIVKGHILAKIVEGGKLDMRYHHLNIKGKIVVGTCISTPIESADGHFKFQEEWHCLSGDNSSGYSEIIEIDSV